MVVEALSGPPVRRTSSRGDRRWVEVRGLNGPDGERIAAEVLIFLKETPGVREAVINEATSRVVVTVAGDGPDARALAGIVAEAEEFAVGTPQRQLPTTLPGDDAALAARLLAAYVSTVGLGIGTAGAALRAMGLTRAVAAPFALAGASPTVRHRIQAHLGPDGTELAMALTSTVTGSLTLSVAGLAKLRPVFDKPYGNITAGNSSQVTDGAACVILASPRFAGTWAARHGKDLDAVARITGFGHRTSRLGLRDKLDRSADAPYLFPHVHAALREALDRAGLRDAWDLSAIECHDCFTVMEYMILDHLGLGPPGRPYAAVLDGSVLAGGRLPVNASGGLLGGGHPVGATGVRMLLDASRQVEGRAGGCQVPGARRVATVNIGGSATTVVSFIIERA